MTRAMVELGRCQVGSGTDRPCRQLAVIKIQGIPFCEACACEQKAYFTIGELTEVSRHPHDNRSLIGRLEEGISVIRRRRVAGGQEPCAA